MFVNDRPKFLNLVQVTLFLTHVTMLLIARIVIQLVTEMDLQVEVVQTPTPFWPLRCHQSLQPQDSGEQILQLYL